MSWVTHDIEPYVIQRKLGLSVAIIPLLVGSYSPDLFSKWLVYGIDIFGSHLEAEDPVEFHRGWPGVGFTHSLAFGAAVALAIYWITGSRVWAVSFMIGNWAHSVSDIGDTVGTMLFFPFSTETISIDAWAYAGQTTRLTDAAAYYSGLGLVWDGFWIVCGLLCWRMLRADYFRSVIAPNDPVWGWMGRRLPEVALLAIYRAMFFYGICRFCAWMIWAHLVNDYSFDLSWGGPHWVEAADR